MNLKTTLLLAALVVAGGAAWWLWESRRPQHALVFLVSDSQFDLNALPANPQTGNEYEYKCQVQPPRQGEFAGARQGHHDEAPSCRLLGRDGDVPTVAESGYPDYEVDLWFGLVDTCSKNPGVMASASGSSEISGSC